MHRPNCFAFKNALKTSAPVKFHFLYSTASRGGVGGVGGLKLCNCDVGGDALVPIAS